MRLSLASKISIAIVGVLALSVLSSSVAIRSAYRFEAIQETLVAVSLESVQAAEELEIALLEQRGNVASYILDGGNPQWLEQLDQYRSEFDVWLDRAHRVARSDEERQILMQLEDVQEAYVQKRDGVIKLFDAGEKEQARQVLLREVSALYHRSHALCEDFIATNQQMVDAASAEVRRQVGRTTVVITGTLVVTVGLGVALLWLFFRGVVFPLRQMAAEMRTVAGDPQQDVTDERGDELRNIGRCVRLLVTDVSETRSDLQQSRTQLAQTDKLAVVGKLAASVAHEVRNPLTSLKMWLYSLRRTVSQDGEVQQKFDMISDEISRVESIVRNFLEFARPPVMCVEPHSISLRWWRLLSGRWRVFA